MLLACQAPKNTWIFSGLGHINSFLSLTSEILLLVSLIREHYFPLQTF